MKELSLNECKQILLDILISIDLCCRENNIPYSLHAGSLLGAVRHSGFIPWDDDIDLLMPREALNRFKESYHDERYELIDEEADQWGWSYTSICDKSTIVRFTHDYERIRNHGLWISIFPVDNKPNNQKKWMWQKLEINFLQNLCRLKRSKWVDTGFSRNIIKSTCRLILAPLSLTYLSKLEKKARCRYNNQDTSECYQKLYIYWVFPSSFIKHFLNLDFEGHQFMAISKYHDFLTLMYGDYMKYPPEDQQIPKHDFIAFKI